MVLMVLAVVVLKVKGPTCGLSPPVDAAAAAADGGHLRGGAWLQQ
jgi:hypothetical protein